MPDGFDKWEKRVMKELTDDYVATWKADPNPKSIFFRLAMVCLPEGVDPEDPRVKDIIEKVKEANPDGFGNEKPS